MLAYERVTNNQKLADMASFWLKNLPVGQVDIPPKQWEDVYRNIERIFYF
jgi:hypothetical protein